MKITRQNYEPFFIDFLEGRLSAEEKKELKGFLELNPDLKAELEDFDEIIVPEDSKPFFKKEGLKKGGNANEINEDNFEQFCIAAAENDLEDRKKEKLIEYIGEDKLKKGVFDLYSKIRLEPENSVIFENKELLYVSRTINIKKRKIFALVSVAASVIILLSLFFLYESPEPSGISETVQQPDSRLPEPFVRSYTAQEVYKSEAVSDIPGDEVADQTAKIGSETFSEDAFPEITRLDDSQYSLYFPEINNRYDMIKIESLPPGAFASALKREIQFQPANLQIYDGSVKPDEIRNQPLSIQSLAQQLTANLIDPAKIPVIGEEGVSMWQIADAGIKGFTRITGREVHFEKETNEEGKTVAFVFESGNFGISRVRAKN